MARFVGLDVSQKLTAVSQQRVSALISTTLR